MKKLFSITLAILTALSFYSYVGKADSPRKILIEEATNTSCGPCAAQNPSFQQFIRNNFDKVIPLIYHAWWPGGNDPMYLENTVMNETRIRYYGIDQQGVPEVRVNGKIAPKTGNWYDGAAGDVTALTNELNTYANATSPITMTVAEQRNGNQSSVSVTIQTSQSLVGKKLRVAVVEYYISYPQPPGSNGEKEFWWVARNMLPDANGTTLNQNAGSNQTYNFSYTIRSNWNAGQIYIVAFIQDDQTKEVLQAAQNLKVAKIQAQVDNRFLKIARGGQTTATIRVTNPDSELTRVEVSINPDYTFTPTNWQYTSSSTELVLAPKETKQVTITIKSANRADFGYVALNLKPKVNTPYEASLTQIFALVEDTKYAAFTLGGSYSPSAIFAYQAMLNNPKYRNDVALIPFTNDILINYPLRDFDLVVLGFNYWSRGILAGAVDPISGATLLNSLNTMISAGKKILITSELDITLTEVQGTPGAKDFFANKLFISRISEPQIRVTVNQQGQITAVNSYPAKGVTGDSIGSGLNFTFNQYNQTSHPYFIAFTDFIKINNQNNVKPFLYYDNDPTKIGGVRINNGSSKIVYLTSGFEAIADATTRNNFIGKIVDWLLGGAPTQKGPEIQVSNTALDFEEVPINTSKTLSTEISNTGDQDLVISELAVDRDFDPDGVFTITNPPSLPLTVKPNQKYTLNVKFLPTEEKVYFSSIKIKSNASNTPDEIITLDGVGAAANVPIISASRTDVDFRDVVPQSSKVLDVDIKNDGGADLQISGIQILGTDASAFTLVNAPELPKTLGAGEILTLTIMFTPSKEGAHTAMLRITSNAQNTPILNINLIGNGVSSVPETEFANGIQIKVTPHPVIDELNLQIMTSKSVDNVLDAKIYDLQGNLILDIGSMPINASKNQLKLSVSTIPSGVYQIRFAIGTETRFVPIIIVR